MPTQNISQQITAALEAGRGVLHLAPTWVPRSFLMPGKRIRLAEQDLYVLGAHRGGIDERWFASTTRADNGPGTPEDEGLSYVVGPDGNRFLLAEAVEAAGAQIIGQQMLAEWGRWPLYCKYFDNMGPIPHHLHQMRHHAEKVGREPKPEAYYFPPQLNPVGNNFPYTFFGLEPGTTREDVYRCLERWNEGDNGILDLSKAYRLKPGTGWLVPPGILHAPGSFCTYEVQWGSDVFAMYQSLVEGRVVPWDLLVKDVPEDKQHDLDYIVGMIDWDANVNPTFKDDHYLEPVAIGDTEREGFQDRWVIYGKVLGEDIFSARELVIRPGARVTVRDNGASCLMVIQGRGKLGPYDVEAATYVRYGDLTWDEYFISEQTARNGFTLENTGLEPLVTLRYFGPGVSADMPEVGAYRQR
ncbi:MAG: hypothetical protein M5U01_22645 [Ardenticatenaceae bacterium]|nr:hypothetical protein [Ardenticatenaceae bacterium]HBY98785.1 hypothetical protein [Chloroflexota bacterium]